MSRSRVIYGQVWMRMPWYADDALSGSDVLRLLREGAEQEAERTGALLLIGPEQERAIVALGVLPEHYYVYPVLRVVEECAPEQPRHSVSPLDWAAVRAERDGLREVVAKREREIDRLRAGGTRYPDGRESCSWPDDCPTPKRCKSGCKASAGSAAPERCPQCGQYPCVALTPARSMP